MQNEVRQTTRECRIGRWTTAIVLLVLGIALAGGGIRLLSLGGSWYYLIGGIALVIIALLLLARRGFLATGLYALFLLGSTLWALAEVGFDWWPLVPRLAIWWVLGLWMLTPWSGRTAQPTSSTSTPSTVPSEQSERRGRFPCIALSVVVALTAMAGIASLFCDRYNMRGTLSLTKNVAQTPAIPAVAPGDWPSYGRDQLGDRYSPLTQITPANAGQLKQAWVIHTGDKKGAGDPIETTNENTPVKVGNTLFICTPHSKVLAVDAATGALRWQFDPKITSPVGFSHFEHMTCRGVSYYDEAAYTGQPPSANACTHRIFLPTADARLIALDADTGKPCDDFGSHGTVDLRENIGTFTPGGYYSTSPPMVTRNLVIIGGHVTDNESTNEPSGVMRAYDVHDGHLVWNWDAGHPDDTAPIAPDKRYTRNSPNMWSVASVDERLGMIYLPMGNQTPDQWGGNRTAQAERFGAGVVALDLATGHVKWAYQFTHHDLWDMDVGGQPTLMDLQTSNGVKPTLIASTKQGSIYVLDRRTGAPLMPITETPVPQGTVSGDHAAPTQPVSALNFNPPRVRESDMWGATPYDQLWCRIDFRSLRYDGAFTPPRSKALWFSRVTSVRSTGEESPSTRSDRYCLGILTIWPLSPSSFRAIRYRRSNTSTAARQAASSLRKAYHSLSL